MNQLEEEDRFEIFLGQALESNIQTITQFHLLNSFPLWDSMSQLVIAAWIHQETGQTVNMAELKQAQTLADLKKIYTDRLSGKGADG